MCYTPAGAVQCIWVGRDILHIIHINDLGHIIGVATDYIQGLPVNVCLINVAKVCFYGDYTRVYNNIRVLSTR